MRYFVAMDGDRVRSVTLENRRTRDRVEISARYIVDATELGDLLELGGVEHVVGAESQAQTGEPDPNDQQSIAWCFPLDYLPGGNHTIPRPRDYAFWRDYRADFWPGKLLDWCDSVPHTGKPHHRGIFFNEPTPDGRDNTTLWEFRRILHAGHYPQGEFPSDITLVNWPQIDYWLGPIVGVPEEEKRRNLDGARQLALSLVYWMQTEAPRHDGKGIGYPGLRMRPDVVDTDDGLAKHVYVREARRIKAEFTVLENHVGALARGKGPLGGPEVFRDSVGVGYYRIDLHPSTASRSYVDLSTFPFQIPLGALLPVRVNNLLPASKNVGTTHITYGCYRLHPVEWNIGEAVGALCAHCIDRNLEPRAVRASASELADFQALLREKLGFVLAWPDYVRRTAFHPEGIN